MKILVTGVGGFVGGHLVRELVSAGHEVVGAGLARNPGPVEELLVDYLWGDLTCAWPTVNVDAVVHLAALSAVGPSFADPQRYIEANSAPVTHLGEHLLTMARPVRTVVVSTGAVYGGGDAAPLTEQSPLVPTSPYAISKMLTEIQCAYYRQRGLDVVVMRPFNHIGPGQGSGFILPDLAEEARTSVRTGHAMTVGNLKTRRDYTDVRDVVRAYRLAVEAPEILAPVLNVCSGASVSGCEILELTTSALGVSGVEVRVDESRLRPQDPPDIRGDNALIRSVLGWAPTIAVETSVRDFVAELDA
ncbi:GDP-mannose 4,6-dehydratase [Nocardioides conyzicola]|uniref:GDP-mannose 4,6-dehydratase n=1 Tax=Nocardioides conyzicola TaxID=1651781 RepID=A0ABP8XIN6_9ACTN